MLSAGIIGLPNVGKSTLFNAITNSQVEAANYPFATIEPNIGIVNVKDQRLVELANLINPDKLTFATFKFVDIAGLVKGASKGEGLGNKFLSNIREVDCICHVIRCFDSNDITHVNNQVNPVADLETVNTELIISDLEVIENRISKISKKASSGDTLAKIEIDLCLKIKSVLDQGLLVNTLSFSEAENTLIKSYNLLTTKPFIYIANISENDINDPEKSIHFKNLKLFLANQKFPLISISSKIESELSLLNEDDKLEMMTSLGMGQESGLDKIIKTAYDILGQLTYFTFGKKEVKAWTFLKGYRAPQCAGIIHSDFERGFIKVEVISAIDLIFYKSEAKAKEAGKLRIEGKEYLMQDGDVCNFRFNV